MIIISNPKYNVNFLTEIQSDTELGDGVRLSKFLGSPGNKATLTDIPVATRFQLARNLYLHAELLQTPKTNKKLFDSVRLIVLEGYYRPWVNETVTLGGINDLKNQGRAVVYQIIGKDGKPDLDRTFDVAEYWKDYIQYDKLILDYDTFDPNGDLTASIIVVMPQMPTSYDVRFENTIDTVFNNKSQGPGELIEIKL